MWLMHNNHDVHAFRETSPGRFESSDYIRRDRGGEERHGSSGTAIAESARRQPGAAARAGLVAPAAFDPVGEKSRFRISGPDNVCTVVLPRLCRQYANGRYQVHFEFHPWQSGIAELVEHGQLDLVLHIDDGLLQSHFQSERLVPLRKTAALEPRCR
jgi:DNA-binding transcriptional LysR family regulator